MQFSQSNKLRLVSVLLASAIVYMDSSIFSIALPEMQRYFKTSEANITWVINAYILARATLVFVVGKLGDFWGHRKLLMLNLWLFLFSSVAACMPISLILLLILRGMQGIHASFIFVSAMTILTTSFSPQSRGRVVGLMLSVGLMSMALGPVLGGILAGLLSWRVIFVFNALIAFLSILIFPRGEGGIEMRAQPFAFDWVGVLISILFTVSANIAFKAFDFTHGFTSGALFLLAVCSGIAFYYHETRHKNPLVDFTLFRKPLVYTGCLVASLMHVTVWLTVFLTFLFQNYFGFSALKCGLLLAPMFIVGIASSNLAGYLVDHYGARLPLLLATGGSSMGIASALFLFKTPNYLELLPLLLLTGFGMTMVSGPVRVSILSSMNAEQHGMANSLLTGFRSITSVIVFALMSGAFTYLNRLFIAKQLQAELPMLGADRLHKLQLALLHHQQVQNLLKTFSESKQVMIQHGLVVAYHHAFCALLAMILIAPVSAFLLTYIKMKKTILEEPVHG